MSLLACSEALNPLSELSTDAASEQHVKMTESPTPLGLAEELKRLQEEVSMRSLRLKRKGRDPDRDLFCMEEKLHGSLILRPSKISPPPHAHVDSVPSPPCPQPRCCTRDSAQRGW